MKAIWVLFALVAALVLQTTISGLTLDGARMVNLVVVAVVYVALTYGPIWGLMAGTGAGLAQDALSSSIVGIGSLSKTVVGFLAGLLGAQFIVAQPMPRLVMFVSASVLHELMIEGLYAVVQTRGFRMSWQPVLIQAVINGIIGLLAFFVVEQMPGVLQRRRARRGRY